MINIVLSHTKQTPIYQQIYDQISSQIMNGDLKAEQLLPSIRTAAKELRVSIITIKTAWEMLETSGFIYTIQGKGSYVREYSKIDLEEKKKATIKQALKEAMKAMRAYDVKKDEIITMISELFDELNRPINKDKD